MEITAAVYFQHTHCILMLQCSICLQFHRKKKSDLEALWDSHRHKLHRTTLSVRLRSFPWDLIIFQMIKWPMPSKCVLTEKRKYQKTNKERIGTGWLEKGCTHFTWSRSHKFAKSTVLPVKSTEIVVFSFSFLLLSLDAHSYF